MLKRVLISASILLILTSSISVTDITGKWKGIIEMPDGDFELFFNFTVDDKEVSGFIDTGMSLDQIEKGIFKTETHFTFESYSEYAQQIISYSATIKEEKITVEIVGFDMWIDLEKVKEE